MAGRGHGGGAGARGREEVFPASRPQCLCPPPGPVCGARGEKPLCFAPVAAVGGAVLSLAWRDGGEQPVCEPVLAGEEGAAGRRVVLSVTSRWGALELRRQPGWVERPELLKVPPPAGQSAPGQVCAPVLSPERQALCNPCPFSSSLAVRKSLRLPAFLSSHSSRMWIPVLREWQEPQVSPSAPPVFAFQPHRSSRASCEVGPCSRSRSPGLGVEQS